MARRGERRIPAAGGMKQLLPAIALLIPLACASGEGWTIVGEAKDGRTRLLVTRPGDQRAYAVLESLHGVAKYAISQRGTYIAYISKESEIRSPDLFIQHLRTGLRIAWSPVGEASGELRFGAGTLSCVSASDRIVIDPDEIARRLR